MASKSSRNIILSIYGSLSSSMDLYSKNLKTDEELSCEISCKTPAELFNKICTFVDPHNVKGCLFCTIDIGKMPFPDGYEFRLQCREFCENNGILCYFGLNFELSALLAISKTRKMVNENNEILVIWPRKKDAVSGIKILRENGYFRLNGIISLENLNPQILQPIQKVIILQDSYISQSSVKKFKTIFKKCHPTIFLNDRYKFHHEASLLKILHLSGEKLNPFDIVSHCFIEYSVNLGEMELFAFYDNEVVPMEKSAIIDVDPSKSVSLHVEKFHPQPLNEIKLSNFKCKKVKVSLKVDMNCFYDFSVDPINDDEIILDKKIPELKAGDKPEKVQLIFDKNYFSVILFANGNNEYKIKDVDGLEKTPIYLSFTRRQPLIGKFAVEMYDQKPEFVVYDLIKLCSITSTNEMDSKWGFKLSKEEKDGPLMVTMDTVDGEKQSSVEFLLALILRNAIKRIRKEIGEIISELEIGFDGFAPNEILKKNFVEAGNLMKCKIVLEI